MPLNECSMSRVMLCAIRYIDIGLMLSQVRDHDAKQLKRVALSENQMCALIEAADLFVAGRTQSDRISDDELVKTLVFGGQFKKAHIDAFTPDQLLSSIPKDLLNRYGHVLEPL